MKDYKISYEVTIEKPHTHFMDILMSIENIESDSISLCLPVWTPGSYMVREYSKNISTINAEGVQGRELNIVKVAKNIWEVMTKGHDSINILYRVYANEETVRTSIVDADHAHLTPASIFLFIEGHTEVPATLKINSPENWNEISTPLKRNGRRKWERKIQCYDELVDSPIEIGNQEIIKFKAGGIPHELALVGESNADKKQLVSDLKRIIDESVKLMGDLPCEEYLFILQNTDNRYNGLEHLDSTACQLPRWDYYPKEKYQQSIGLLSHEYFHLWNVKRIRPKGLGPFNYVEENYTTLLWFIEGVTSYYDDYLLYRSEIFTRQEYLDALAKVLTNVVNTPGDSIQSLADASFDAWIKFYRRNENSSNVEVSYYKKGATVVEAVNFIILKESKGKYSFDDVMRKLYEDYKRDPDVGYSEEDILSTIEHFAGRSLKRFFKNHIYGTKAVNYKKYFADVGLNLIDKNLKNNEVNWGWSLKVEENVTVSALNRNYGAYQSGIDVGDEILAINGFRADKDYEQIIERIKVGQNIDVLVNRKGKIRKIKVIATKDQDVKYKLELTKNLSKLQKRIIKAWLPYK